MNGQRAAFVADEHLGDRAELYALGVLDVEEADRVNAHAAVCANCSRLVGAAEVAVAALDAGTVPDVAPPLELERRVTAIGFVSPLRRTRVLGLGAIARWGALAAGLVLAVGGVFATREVVHMRAVVAQDDAAFAVIANSHFKHATMTKVDANAPTAKVLWGTSNTWVYVVVDSAACACRVFVNSDAGQRDFGVPLARADTSVLFLSEVRGARGVELQRDGSVLERVALK